MADEQSEQADGGVATAQDTLTVTDNRTGDTYEVDYRLIHGELPSQPQLDAWVHEVTIHTYVHENIKKFVEGFRYDAHPMGILLASVGALSTFYPGAKQIEDDEERHMAAVRLIAKMPTLAAFAYRHNLGRPYVYPVNDLSYGANFPSMLLTITA